MGSPFVSRWPVVITATITPDDCAADGALTPAALGRLVDPERCCELDAVGAWDTSSS